MEKNSKIVVTGCQGMIGWAVVRALQRSGYTNVYGIDKTDCDLRNTQAVNTWFNQNRPEYIFHIAAKVGGINANNKLSGEFIYDNLMIQCNVLEAARKFVVKKLIFCGSACIYPKNTPMPIKEEYFLTGPLEETNIGYAIAKISGVVMCKMYRKQHNCNFISVMPTNLYGMGDNFHLTDSHVLPALIRKFHDAKISGVKSVEVWGTGEIKREFLYCDDLAEALVFLMNTYNGADPINVGTGESIYIKQLVEYIQAVIGFEGTVVWNTAYPDGVTDRRMDVTKINSLGWYAKVKLEEGIKKTYEWFAERYPEHVRI